LEDAQELGLQQQAHVADLIGLVFAPESPFDPRSLAKHGVHHGIGEGTIEGPWPPLWGYGQGVLALDGLADVLK